MTRQRLNLGEKKRNDVLSLFHVLPVLSKWGPSGGVGSLYGPYTNGVERYSAYLALIMVIVTIALSYQKLEIQEDPLCDMVGTNCVYSWKINLPLVVSTAALVAVSLISWLVNTHTHAHTKHTTSQHTHTHTHKHDTSTNKKWKQKNKKQKTIFKMFIKKS